MTSSIRTNLIPISWGLDAQALRERVYQGQRLLLPLNEATERLVTCATRAWTQALECSVEELERAQFQHSPQAFYARQQHARKLAAQDPALLDAQRQVIEALGLWDEDALAWDHLRLRAIPHLGHLEPAAALAYGAHRDTWYANPPCQLNLWVSLFDASAQQCFMTYPQAFDRAVENTSAGFDYEVFMSRVGWQGGASSESAPLYPSAPQEHELSWGQGAREDIGRGQLMVFSAAHLHQSMPNLSGTTRFSLDFRLVWRPDQRLGRGAPDLDNASSGDASIDYMGASKWPS